MLHAWISCLNLYYEQYCEAFETHPWRVCVVVFPGDLCFFTAHRLADLLPVCALIFRYHYYLDGQLFFSGLLSYLGNWLGQRTAQALRTDLAFICAGVFNLRRCRIRRSVWFVVKPDR